MIAIIDYGAGNLRSVQNAFAHVGAAFEVVRDSAGLRRAKRIVLPGVGHFGQMMSALDALDLRDEITRCIRIGLPFLGICLGLQALYETSTESQAAIGLGIFPGRVERFPDEARVPHMGWNNVSAARSSRLCLPNEINRYAYFAHSYYVPVGEESSLVCTYSRPFSAAVEKENCFGLQFHPEKSGTFGLGFLQRFAEL